MVAPHVIGDIHSASLEVLERVGIQVRSERALADLAAAGAKVDPEQERAWLPAALVEEKVALAPASYTLAARDPSCDLAMGTGLSHLGPDGSCPEFIDLSTGEKRFSSLDDLAKITRVFDAVPEIGFTWCSVPANDVLPPVRSLHHFLTQVRETSKHMLQTSIIKPDQAEAVLRMAYAVSGGEAEFRSRPLMSNFQCSISPLMWDGEPLESMRILAQGGVPVGICAMTLACATAPATLTGSLVQANAEILAGMTILETMVPSAPTFYVSYPTSIDLHSGSMQLAWGPEELWMQAVQVQLARRYSIPVVTGLFATGAKSRDWQAGVQHGLSSMLGALAPGDLMSDAGSLYGVRVFSLEALLLDCEIYGILLRTFDGFATDAESMALDDIASVGPGGHYLASPNTLAHMRDFWRSAHFDGGTWEEWEAAGRPTPADRAHGRVLEILEEHRPMALPDGVEAELDAIVEAFPMPEDYDPEAFTFGRPAC
jgi:trimethylamine--corrinoid protein Co-methyltransferase